MATITVGTNGPYQEDIGTVTAGESAIPIPILDMAGTSKVIVAVRDRYSGAVFDTQEWNWQPQKKWKLYSVSYSHHDLGFRQLPAPSAHRNSSRQHRAPAGVLRRTDTWDEDSKFRYMIETTEPITSFLGSHSEADAVELGRRIREGRIQIGGLHSTVNTEQMSENSGRLSIVGLRHTPDLLGAPPGKTAQK